MFEDFIFCSCIEAEILKPSLEEKKLYTDFWKKIYLVYHRENRNVSFSLVI